ncbi:hypothetical protein BGZ76_002291 [Entomortierella beljakovae]|nr:hypothetical protein BGZ76_002291 [Entomortierella beljakovae]
MDPEDSPELPPLKRGAYDIDAILAAAGDLEFAVPPPSKSSFNRNPFASSTPSSFRSNFNSSTAPSINNSPYPTSASSTTIDGLDFPAPPTARPPAPPKKTVTPTTTRKKVSTLKSSTISKFAPPAKKPDSDISFADTPTTTTTTADSLDSDSISNTNNINNNHQSNGINNNDGFSGGKGLSAGRGNEDFEDKQSSIDGTSNTTTTTATPITTATSPIINSIRARAPFRGSPFNRVGSPPVGGGGGNSSHLEASSPSRASSPNNVSSNSLGAGNELAVYSTPSSSRPTSRPTSRPNSRVSNGNGRFHSRQLSSDSLTSFNAMINKEDLDDDDELNRSGHVSFVVSDPEHLKILEGEIEDPFSPSLSSIDPGADAYLNNLLQQTSPFGSIKSNSRGQSPAFKTRRQRQTEGAGSGGGGGGGGGFGGAGDESFFDSADDALSDREVNSKFRSSRTGTRTPSSPLARAMTRASPRQIGAVVSALTSAGNQLSLDQVLNESLELEGGQNSQDAAFKSSNSLTGQFNGSFQPSSNGSLKRQDGLKSDDDVDVDDGSLLPPTSSSTLLESDFGHSDSKHIDGKFQKRNRGHRIIEQVEVDIVVQSIRDINDDTLSLRRQNGFPLNDINSNSNMSGLGIHDSHDLYMNNNSGVIGVGVGDGDSYYQTGIEALANEEMHLHESLENHESHAQSFADWMSSSAEISRLDISPPVGPGHFSHPSSLAGLLAMTPASPTAPIPIAGTNNHIVDSTTDPAGSHGTSLLSSDLGNAHILTSSYTPALSSPEASSSSMSTSPNVKRAMLLEKRLTLMDDIMARHTKHKDEATQILTTGVDEMKKLTPPPGSSSSSSGPEFPSEEVEATESPHSVKFSGVNDVKFLEATDPQEELNHQIETNEGGGGYDETLETSSVPISALERKDLGLVRRPSGIMLSSRIRDSTNLDAPRYSIREMEDMKKNARMDLRIEITNEIREEYERSAEQEAAMYQSEIDELKAALEKEKRDKAGLKSVLDEFESSLEEFAVSTAAEITSIKEQNKKLTENKEEVEEAFVVLKARYDELKDLNSKHVDNEGILRKAIEALKQDFETSESRYDNLRGHADAKMLMASQEMEQIKMGYDSEIAMLKGQLSRQEMQVRALEQAVEIKKKENEELIMFSEELISKLS